MTTHRHTLLGRALLAVLPWLAPGLAQAVQAQAVADLSTPAAADVQRVDGPGYVGRAEASAQAAYGSGKVVAAALTSWAVQPGENAGTRGAFALAQASFSDVLTLGSAAHDGELAVLWFGALLQYGTLFNSTRDGDNVNVVMTGSAAAYWDVVTGSVTTVGGGCHFALGDVADPGERCDGFTPGSGGAARGRYGVVVVFGQPFTLTLRSSAAAVASVGLQNAGSFGEAFFQVDAGNSVYWDGIDSVTTLDGVAVDYTVSALSGNDYTTSFAPVPEPPAALLLGPALALLLPLAARRRRRAAA